MKPTDFFNSREEEALPQGQVRRPRAGQAQVAQGDGQEAAEDVTEGEEAHVRTRFVTASERRRARCADNVSSLSPQAQVSTGTVLVMSITWKARFSVAQTKSTSARLAHWQSQGSVRNSMQAKSTLTTKAYQASAPHQHHRTHTPQFSISSPLPTSPANFSEKSVQPGIGKYQSGFARRVLTVLR